MPQNKNQHYVPKFYFRLFSKNQNTICNFNLSGEKFIEHATIRGQCSKNYFYSKNTEIEKTFSYLEGLSNAKLRKIIENKNLDCLSEEEIEHLKSHIFFQYGRTKHAFDRENDMANYFFDLMKPSIYEQAKNEGKEFSWDDIKNVSIVVNDHQILLMSMMSCFLVSDLKIILLENKSKMDLIFSDNPVVLFNSFFNYTYPYGTIGLASTGLQVFYPINSKLMLILYDSNFYNFKNSSSKIKTKKNKDIQRINGLQILNCDKTIYFENFEIRDKIFELYQRLKIKKPSKLNEFEIMDRGIAEDGTYRELLRTSAPKVDYNLEKLSFLFHKKSDSTFGVRNEFLTEIYNQVINAIMKKEIQSMDDLEKFMKNMKKKKN